MIKSVGKFIWRIAKCVIGAAAVCFGGYYVSYAINWLTGNIMDFLAKAGKYLMGNWVAIIWVVVALIIGGIVFELIADAVREWRSNRAVKKAQRKGQNRGEHES